ncbi:hypothetical protein RIF29_26407 [Crotalaria pallida]|uniref:B-like cyclin n=1 Tax=Crotalaria pallida TaxID=3830 RepID=A0AAN9ENC1_CROPI
MASRTESEFKILYDLERVKTSFEMESNFMAEPSYYDNLENLKMRRLAVCEIARHCSNIDEVHMDAFVPYLAMNFFDCYVTKTEKPYSDVHDVRKIAITCLFIAARLRTRTAVFFPENMPFEFDIGIIEGTEQRITSRLESGLLSVTPFAFLDYYYRPTFHKIGGFKRRCINQIIVQAQGVDCFIKYKHSQIAFSSLLAATEIAYPTIQIDTPHELVNAKLVAVCAKKLIEVCDKKIKIEKAEPETASSSCATVAMALGKSEEVAAETESDQQSLSEEVADTSDEEVAAETESDQQSLSEEVADTSDEEVAAAETESDQQSLSEEVADASDEEVEAAEITQGTIVNIVEIPEDDLTEAERLREAKGKAPLVEYVVELPEDEGEEHVLFSDEAPKFMMNFHLLWPTSAVPYVDCIAIVVLALDHICGLNSVSAVLFSLVFDFSIIIADHRLSRSADIKVDIIMEIERFILIALEDIKYSKPVTPFCFLDYFYPQFKSIGGFKRRCINEIIVQAQGEDKFMDYKPSEIALTSFLAATRIAYPSKMFIVSGPLPKGLRNCYHGLVDLCRSKGIKIVRGNETETETKTESDKQEQATGKEEDTKLHVSSSETIES